MFQCCRIGAGRARTVAISNITGSFNCRDDSLIRLIVAMCKEKLMEHQVRIALMMRITVHQRTRSARIFNVNIGERY